MAISSQGIHGIALAAGAGGLELGLSLALSEYRTVCWCERDAYAASALVARMEDAALDEAPIWSDLGTFDGKPWRGKVDIISAGYPCQPFSMAGKRLGDKDPRHLWPQVRRIVEEARPRLLFAENVLGHVTLGLEQVWNDFQALGYSVEAGIYSAAEVGASHIRKRLFILAYADSGPIRDMARRLCKKRQTGYDQRQVSTRDTHSGDNVDAAVYGGNGEAPRLFPPHADQFVASRRWRASRSDLQPALAGTHDGLAFKMDRYRLAGNGVCPLAAAYAFCSLVFAATKRHAEIAA